jgi:hypothetical protein
MLGTAAKSLPGHATNPACLRPNGLLDGVSQRAHPL